MYTSPSKIVSAACLSLCLLPAVSATYFSGTDADAFHWNKAEHHQPSPRSAPRSASRSSSGSFTLPLRRVLVPRNNVYNITKSKATTFKDSTPIHQDGMDLTYMISVKIGTSQEEWYFLVDSASSNSWVMAKDCKTEACGFHNLFGPDDSTTLKTTTATWDISYGTGRAFGVVGRDSMQIGPLKFTSDFGLASNVSYEFAGYPCDGVMAFGLGDRFSTGGVETDSNLVMNELVKQGQIKNKIFGMHLGTSSTGNHDGELNFGALNKDRYDGDINWNKVKDNDNGFWWITLGGAGVGNTALQFPGREAIMDSGTSFILLPPKDAEILHSPFKGKPGYFAESMFYYVPCDTTDPIWLSFNNKRYNIPANIWIAKKDENGRCRSNFQARAIFGETTWLVGATFLKNAYTVYDYDNKQFGLGLKGANTNAGGNSTNPSGTVAPGPASTGGTNNQKPNPSGTPTQGSGNGNGNGNANGQQGSSTTMKPSQSALLALAFAIGGAMLV